MTKYLAGCVRYSVVQGSGCSLKNLYQKRGIFESIQTASEICVSLELGTCQKMVSENRSMKSR